MWAISRVKSVSPTSPYIGSSIRKGIRKMCGLDESRKEIDIDSFGDAVDAVWDGPGTYEIEPLVCSACPLDVTCFDREGLECELIDMYRHELNRRDKVEIRLVDSEL